jgi:hypothetical protein
MISLIRRFISNPFLKYFSTGAGGGPPALERGVRRWSRGRPSLSARERDICARIGPSLRERGLLFVGIDVIDGYLTEINVTSPTGIRAVKNLGGPTSPP